MQMTERLPPGVATTDPPSTASSPATRTAIGRIRDAVRNVLTPPQSKTRPDAAQDQPCLSSNTGTNTPSRNNAVRQRTGPHPQGTPAPPRTRAATSNAQPAKDLHGASLKNDAKIEQQQCGGTLHVTNIMDLVQREAYPGMDKQARLLCGLQAINAVAHRTDIDPFSTTYVEPAARVSRSQNGRTNAASLRNGGKSPGPPGSTPATPMGRAQIIRAEDNCLVKCKIKCAVVAKLAFGWNAVSASSWALLSDMHAYLDKAHSALASEDDGLAWHGFVMQQLFRLCFHSHALDHSNGGHGVASIPGFDVLRRRADAVCLAIDGLFARYLRLNPADEPETPEIMLSQLSEVLKREGKELYTLWLALATPTRVVTNVDATLDGDNASLALQREREARLAASMLPFMWLARIRGQTHTPHYAKLWAILAEVHLVPNEFRELLTRLRFMQHHTMATDLLNTLAAESVDHIAKYLHRHPRGTVLTYVDNMCKHIHRKYERTDRGSQGKHRSCGGFIVPPDQKTSHDHNTPWWLNVWPRSEENALFGVCFPGTDVGIPLGQEGANIRVSYDDVDALFLSFEEFTTLGIQFDGNENRRVFVRYETRHELSQLETDITGISPHRGLLLEPTRSEQRGFQCVWEDMLWREVSKAVNHNGALSGMWRANRDGKVQVCLKDELIEGEFTDPRQLCRLAAWSGNNLRSEGRRVAPEHYQNFPANESERNEQRANEAALNSFAEAQQGSDEGSREDRPRCQNVNPLPFRGFGISPGKKKPKAKPKPAVHTSSLAKSTDLSIEDRAAKVREECKSLKHTCRARGSGGKASCARCDHDATLKVLSRQIETERRRKSREKSKRKRSSNASSNPGEPATLAANSDTIASGSQREADPFVRAVRVLYLPPFLENETRNDGLSAIALKIALLRSSEAYRFYAQSDQRGRWLHSGDLLTIIRYVSLRECLEDALASDNQTLDPNERDSLIEVASLLLPLDTIIGLLHRGFTMLDNAIQDIWPIGGLALKTRLRRTDMRPGKTAQQVRRKREFLMLLTSSWLNEAIREFVRTPFYTDLLDGAQDATQGAARDYALLFVRQFSAFCDEASQTDLLFRSWYSSFKTSALLSYYQQCAKFGAAQSGRLIEKYWAPIFDAHNNSHYFAATIDECFAGYFWSPARNRIAEMMWTYPRTDGIVGAYGGTDDTQEEHVWFVSRMLPKVLADKDFDAEAHRATALTGFFRRLFNWSRGLTRSRHGRKFATRRSTPSSQDADREIVRDLLRSSGAARPRPGRISALAVDVHTRARNIDVWSDEDWRSVCNDQILNLEFLPNPVGLVASLSLGAGSRFDLVKTKRVPTLIGSRIVGILSRGRPELDLFEIGSEFCAKLHSKPVDSADHITERILRSNDIFPVEVIDRGTPEFPMLCIHPRGNNLWERTGIIGCVIALRLPAPAQHAGTNIVLWHRTEGSANTLVGILANNSYQEIFVDFVPQVSLSLHQLLSTHSCLPLPISSDIEMDSDNLSNDGEEEKKQDSNEEPLLTISLVDPGGGSASGDQQRSVKARKEETAVRAGHWANLQQNSAKNGRLLRCLQGTIATCDTESGPKPQQESSLNNIASALQRPPYKSGCSTNLHDNVVIAGSRKLNKRLKYYGKRHEIERRARNVLRSVARGESQDADMHDMHTSRSEAVSTPIQSRSVPHHDANHANKLRNFAKQEHILTRTIMDLRDEAEEHTANYIKSLFPHTNAVRTSDIPVSITSKEAAENLETRIIVLQEQLKELRNARVSFMQHANRVQLSTTSPECNSPDFESESDNDSQRSDSENHSEEDELYFDEDSDEEVESGMESSSSLQANNQGVQELNECETEQNNGNAFTRGARAVLRGISGITFQRLHNFR